MLGDVYTFFFGSASHSFCSALADAGFHTSPTFVHSESLSAFVGCQFIPLHKCSEVRLIGVGEVPRCINHKKGSPANCWSGWKWYLHWRAACLSIKFKVLVVFTSWILSVSWWNICLTPCMLLHILHLIQHKWYVAHEPSLTTSTFRVCWKLVCSYLYGWGSIDAMWMV